MLYMIVFHKSCILKCYIAYVIEHQRLYNTEIFVMLQDLCYITKKYVTDTHCYLAHPNLPDVYYHCVEHTQAGSLSVGWHTQACSFWSIEPIRACQLMPEVKANDVLRLVQLIHLEKRHPAISRLIPRYPWITQHVTYPGISLYK